MENDKTAFCTKCGARQKSDALFCSSCGTKLDIESETLNTRTDKTVNKEDEKEKAPEFNTPRFIDDEKVDPISDLESDNNPDGENQRHSKYLPIYIAGFVLILAVGILIIALTTINNKENANKYFPEEQSASIEPSEPTYSTPSPSYKMKDSRSVGYYELSNGKVVEYCCYYNEYLDDVHKMTSYQFSNRSTAFDGLYTLVSGTVYQVTQSGSVYVSVYCSKSFTDYYAVIKLNDYQQNLLSKISDEDSVEILARIDESSYDIGGFLIDGVSFELYDGIVVKQNGMDIDVPSNFKPGSALQYDDEEEYARPPASYYSDYLLPYSDSEYVTTYELDELSWEECCLARNEIYARHGRKFQTPEISDYFNTKSWYQGTVSAGNFSNSVLNKYELENVTIISNYENSVWGGSYY